MATLVFSQILFYFSVSITVIILGLMMGVVVYRVIKIAKSLQQISENIEDASDDLGERLEDVLHNLSTLPILSFFFKNKKRGRAKSK